MHISNNIQPGETGASKGSGGPGREDKRWQISK